MLFRSPAGALVLEIRSEATGPARKQEIELKPGETKEATLTNGD